MSKYLSRKYLLISKQTGTLAYAVQIINFSGSPGGSTPKLCQNICLLNIYILKKTWHLSLSRSKIDFWEVHLGVTNGGGGVPQTMSKYLSLKYLLISKNIGTPNLAVQKIDVRRVHLVGGISKLCRNICPLSIC